MPPEPGCYERFNDSTLLGNLGRLILNSRKDIRKRGFPRLNQIIKKIAKNIEKTLKITSEPEYNIFIERIHTKARLSAVFKTNITLASLFCKQKNNTIDEQSQPRCCGRKKGILIE